MEQAQYLMVEVGEQAPQIIGLSTKDKFNLENTKSNTVLVFYPKDGTSVCSSQLALYNELLPVIKDYNAEIVGISVDNMESHHKFAKHLSLNFPLIPDNDPKGSISQQYNVYDPKKKRSKRALFVVDQKGTVVWKFVSPDEINPGADGILQILEKL